MLHPMQFRAFYWVLVEQNYDQMIKYATAIRQGTASTEAIPAPLHPLSVPPDLPGDARGRAQRTIFVALMWNQALSSPQVSGSHLRARPRRSRRRRRQCAMYQCGDGGNMGSGLPHLIRGVGCADVLSNLYV